MFSTRTIFTFLKLDITGFGPWLRHCSCRRLFGGAGGDALTSFSEDASRSRIFLYRREASFCTAPRRADERFVVVRLISTRQSTWPCAWRTATTPPITSQIRRCTRPPSSPLSATLRSAPVLFQLIFARFTKQADGCD
jgi:hypothetical protein